MTVKLIRRKKGLCAFCGAWKKKVSYVFTDETGENWRCDECTEEALKKHFREEKLKPVPLWLWIFIGSFLLIGITAIAIPIIGEF